MASFAAVLVIILLLVQVRTVKGINLNATTLWHEYIKIRPPLMCRQFPWKRRNDSCEDRCGESRDSRVPDAVCYCDNDLCSLNGDCCADYYLRCNKTVQHPKYRCSPRSDQSFAGSRIITISTCKQEHGLKLDDIECQTERTDSIIHALPVVGSDYNVYRNAFCARCNGVEVKEYFRVKVSCKTTTPCLPVEENSDIVSTLNKLLTQRSTKLSLIKPTNSTVEECTVVSDCPLGTDEQKIHMCTQYSSPVYGYGAGIKFNNPHCAECNHIGWRIGCLDTDPIEVGNIPLPLTILFNFNPKSPESKRIEVEKSLKCEYSRVFDPFRNRCVESWMIPPTRREFPTPTDFPTRPEIPILPDLPTLPELPTLPPSNRTYPRPDIHSESVLRKINSCSVCGTCTKPIVSTDENDTDCLWLKSTNKTPDSIDFQSEEVYIFLTSPENTTGATRMCFEDSVSFPSCEYYTAIYITDASNESGYTFEEDFYDTKHCIYTDGRILVCIPQKIVSNFCSTYIKLERTDFTLMENKSILVFAHKTLYPQDKYMIENNSTYLCVDFRSNYNGTVVIEAITTTNTRIIEQYLTTICFSMSIVFLFFLLVTYILFGELRTVPGCNLMGLSSIMMTSQIVFLAGAGKLNNEYLCTAVAVLLHYLFLASFGWMCVMAYNVHRTFSRKGQPSRRTKTGRVFRIYCLLACGLPLIIVLPSVLVDQTAVGIVGYGKGSSCWIANPWASLVVFALPVLIVIVYNFISLIRTLVSLHKAHEISSQVNTSMSVGRQAKTYLKLTSLMGLTWILGYGAAFEPTNFMKWPFIVLSGLQGVFICCSFAMNKKVWKNYKKMVCGKKPTDESMRSGLTPSTQQTRDTTNKERVAITYMTSKATRAGSIDDKIEVEESHALAQTAV